MNLVFKRPQVHQNPFQNFFNSTGIERSRKLTEHGASGSIDAVRIRQKVSIEESFHMQTYTKAGIFQEKSSISEISLSDIQQIIRKVESFARSLKDDFESGIIEDDPKTLLKKLILKEFWGLEPSGADIISLDFMRSGFSFDFELDFDGVLKAEGRAICADLHYELHLDFTEEITRIHAARSPDRGLKKYGNHLVDTGRYLIGFSGSSTFSIFDKASNFNIKAWGAPRGVLSHRDDYMKSEVSDIKEGSIKTILKLLDSTSVNCTSCNGPVRYVDVFKGNEHEKISWGS